MELHLTGTAGLLAFGLHGLSMSVLDPSGFALTLFILALPLHRTLTHTAPGVCGAVRLDVGAALLSRAICMVDHVMAVEDNGEGLEITVEEGPTDPSAEVLSAAKPIATPSCSSAFNTPPIRSLITQRRNNAHLVIIIQPLAAPNPNTLQIVGVTCGSNLTGHSKCGLS